MMERKPVVVEPFGRDRWLAAGGRYLISKAVMVVDDSLVGTTTSTRFVAWDLGPRGKRQDRVNQATPIRVASAQSLSDLAAILAIFRVNENPWRNSPR